MDLSSGPLNIGKTYVKVKDGAVVVLELGGTPVRNISALSGLSRLEAVFLNGTQVSDISALSGLKNLRGLNLANTQVSDIRPLMGLPNLQLVDLVHTNVSDADVAALRQARPQLTVYK